MNTKVLATTIALMLAASAVQATAIPIRNVRVQTTPDFATISALVYSPAGASSCGALVGMSITDVETGQRRFKHFGRINVCRAEAGNYTVGLYRRTAYVLQWPVATYRICIVAQQNVNGRRSAHGICRYRRI
jgi:hypothetical protein